MNEIAQQQDQQAFEQILENIFKDLEDGIMLTMEEIADLRYACGLPAKNTKNTYLIDFFNDMGNSFGSAK